MEDDTERKEKQESVRSFVSQCSQSEVAGRLVCGPSLGTAVPALTALIQDSLSQA